MSLGKLRECHGEAIVRALALAWDHLPFLGFTSMSVFWMLNGNTMNATLWLLVAYVSNNYRVLKEVRRLVKTENTMREILDRLLRRM